EGTENLLNDFGYAQVLEDAAVGALSKVPEPGYNPCSILPQAARRQRSGAPLRDHTVNGPRLAIIRHDYELDLVANHAFRGYGNISREHFQFVKEQFGNAFPPIKRRKK